MAKFTVVPSMITFPSISVEARGDHDPDKEIKRESYSIRSSLDWDPDDNTLNINIGLKNAEDEDPDEYNKEYEIDIHIYAIFSVTDDYPSLSEKTALRVLADISACMFGSIREMLTIITSRSPWGPYMLPLLDADDLAKNLYELNAKKLTKTKALKKK